MPWSMFEPWSREGFWWSDIEWCTDPDSRNVIPGRIDFHPLPSEPLNLSLYGARNRLWDGASQEEGNLRSLEIRQKLLPLLYSDIFKSTTTPSWLYGLTVDGIKITAIDVVAIGSSCAFGSELSNVTTCRPRLLVANMHVLPNACSFKSAVIRFPDFTEFINPRQIIEASENRDIFKINNQYHSLTSNFMLSGAQTSVAFLCKPSVFYLPDIELAANVTSQLQITPSQPQELEWFLQAAFSFQSFFSILYGRPIRIESLLLEPVLGDIAVVYFAQTRSSSDKNDKEFLFRVTDFDQSVICRALEKWLSAPVDLHSLIFDFFSRYPEKHECSNVDLIAYAQVMEIFHVLTLSSVDTISPLVKETVTKLKTQLRDIQKDSKIDHKDLESIYAALAFAGRTSQKSRLKELMEIAASYYQADLFYENNNNFIECIVETRNHYVHGSKPKAQKFLNEVEQRAAVAGMRLVIQLLLFQYLDIPPDRLYNKIWKSDLRNDWLALKHRFLPAERLQFDC